MGHKCDGCKYKGEHQEMMFRPMGVCNRGVNLFEAIKNFEAEKCPYKKTNADRIRAMSDEELAVFVRAIIMAEDCPVTGCDCDKCFFKEVCFNGSKWYGKEMEWLKQPAEE